MLVFFACAHSESKPKIKDGDIIFRGNDTQGLSDAINSVTQTNAKTNYTHIGICFIKNDTSFVIHATPNKGVCIETIETFMQPDTNTKYISDIYRLKKDFRSCIPNAISKAKSLVGAPYDYTYIMDSEGFYCSEFIYHIFEACKVFTLNPMTFKNPNSNNFHSEWIEHYNELQIPIPEGELGCNPNGMATDSTIEKILL